jgi:hypothetical protein
MSILPNDAGQSNNSATRERVQVPAGDVAELPLLPQHLADLRKSGLTDDTIRSMGVYSETDPRKVCKLRFGRITLDLLRASEKLGPCLVFPFFDPSGDVVKGFARIKPDNPEAEKKGKKKGRPKKYLSPVGGGNRLYIPPAVLPAIADPTAPLVIAEGEKKAAAATQAGLPCIGVTGVRNWHLKGDPTKLLPEFHRIPLKGRRVTLLFDSDAETNHQVMDALHLLAAALSAAGAIVFIATLPHLPNGDKCGADDYLVAHGPAALAAVVADAKRFEWTPPATKEEQDAARKDLLRWIGEPLPPELAAELVKEKDAIRAATKAAPKLKRKLGPCHFKKKWVDVGDPDTGFMSVRQPRCCSVGCSGCLPIYRSRKARKLLWAVRHDPVMAWDESGKPARAGWLKATGPRYTINVPDDEWEKNKKRIQQAGKQANKGPIHPSRFRVRLLDLLAGMTEEQRFDLYVRLPDRLTREAFACVVAGRLEDLEDGELEYVLGRVLELLPCEETRDDFRDNPAAYLPNSFFIRIRRDGRSIILSNVHFSGATEISVDDAAKLVAEEANKLKLLPQEWNKKEERFFRPRPVSMSPLWSLEDDDCGLVKGGGLDGDHEPAEVYAAMVDLGMAPEMTNEPDEPIPVKIDTTLPDFVPPYAGDTRSPATIGEQFRQARFRTIESINLRLHGLAVDEIEAIINTTREDSPVVNEISDEEAALIRAGDELPAAGP